MAKNLRVSEYENDSVYFRKSTQSLDIEGYLTNFVMKDGGKTVHFEFIPIRGSRERYNGSLTTYDRSYQLNLAPFLGVNLTEQEVSRLKSTIEQTRRTEL